MWSRPPRAIGCLALILLLSILTVPLARAQSNALYFPTTGHHLTDNQGFLSFWQAHNGEQLLGFPVTEALQSDSGAIQYFEKGRLEQQSDPATGASPVRNGSVGTEYAEALWRSFAAAPPRKLAPSELGFATTGHTLRAPFLGFWQAAGGLDFFGAPISEALWEVTEHGQRQVQYFERARLERDATMAGTSEEIQVSDLGRSLALLRGLDTAAIANWGAEIYGPAPAIAPDIAPLHVAAPAAPAPAAPVAPAPAAPATRATPAAPAPARAKPVAARPAPTASGKYIIVNLSKQWLYAFADGEQVFDAPVSTGRDGMNTPSGTYAIYAKLPIQTMRGVLDGVPWVVPDIPNVMYINGGVALHGTYWHNQFGTGARLSHGCVNLPLRAAAWLYGWATLGTPVRVTY
jgi:lipoprotein-anchoring transpeptidase ErfK/SrfK